MLIDIWVTSFRQWSGHVLLPLTPLVGTMLSVRRVFQWLLSYDEQRKIPSSKALMSDDFPAPVAKMSISLPYKRGDVWTSGSPPQMAIIVVGAVCPSRLFQTIMLTCRLQESGIAHPLTSFSQVSLRKPPSSWSLLTSESISSTIISPSSSDISGEYLDATGGLPWGPFAPDFSSNMHGGHWLDEVLLTSCGVSGPDCR